MFGLIIQNQRLHMFFVERYLEKKKKHLAFRISEQQFPDTQKLWLPLLPFKKRIQPPKTRNQGRRESWVFAAAEPSLVETWASPPSIFRVPALKFFQGSKTLVHPWTEPLMPWSTRWNTRMVISWKPRSQEKNGGFLLSRKNWSKTRRPISDVSGMR